MSVIAASPKLEQGSFWLLALSTSALQSLIASCIQFSPSCKTTWYSPSPAGSAKIDPSSSPPPIPTRSFSRREVISSSSAHSTPRPASRRSNVTSQIYQFALGYPQTPPETSPVRESKGAATEYSGAGNKMGSFLFRWEHPANEVYVTGTFDDWARSVKLDRKGSHFEKLVELPQANEKIFYKFVVDGNWTTDHTASQESDESNNVNNVLLPEDLSTAATTSIMSGVTPNSTTVGLAANVPKESQRAEQELRPESASSDVPGSFPETPFHDANEFAVDPIPATSGMGNPVILQPGDKVPHPNTLTDNTIQSTVRDDPSLKKNDRDSEQTFGVAPIPGTSGGKNPISLQPGEKVPHHSTFTENTIDSNVTTDKESYENAGSANLAGPDKSVGATRDIPSMPPVLGTMIPESSLPMGDAFGSSDPGVTIQSAGANSTTAALAGQVPLEPRGVPTVVSESQQEAGASPEASGSAEAVKEKTAMEKELESKVTEEPATSESTAGYGTGPGKVAEGITSQGASAAVSSAPGSKGLPTSIQQSIDEMNKGSGTTPIAPTVPDVVQESITEAHQSPEAAGDKTMVAEKKAVEQELLSELPKENDVGEPAPSSTAALTEKAPTATGSGAAANKDSAQVTTAAAPAQTPAAQNSVQQAVQSEPDSRDISPMSKPINPQQAQPTVTTGVSSSSAPQKSETPAQAAAAAKPSPTSTSSAATDKKAKRSSGFFGKLKSKFSDKDKK